MSAEVFLSVIAVSAAFIMLLVSISSLVQKQRAEREFLNILAQGIVATSLREHRFAMMKYGAVSASELQRLTDRLGGLAGELSKEHRLQIERGLRQPSLRGRARYAAKLLNRAGVGSGEFPIAIP